jgi:CO/xanthine dehydrogenase FAD-binding subunit
VKVVRPTTLGEALDAKAADPDLVPVAGGTDLWVHWPQNLAGRERSYLDLGGLPELRHVGTDDDELVLGAGATYWDVLCDETCAREFPLLGDAARQVGAVQIQSRGTWAGNIANGSPAADGVPVLMAYDAEVVLASARGERRVALDAYYTGYRASVAAPDELIRSIHVPRRAYELQRFEKVGSRRAQTIAKVGAAVTVADGAWRVVAASLAPTVCRCPALEEVLSAGRALTGPEDLLAAVDADVTPIDDLRSTAAYRRNVFARILYAIVAS